MNRHFLGILIVAFARASFGQIVYGAKVEFRNAGAPGKELRDVRGAPLTAGSDGFGDGAQLQFGYFSLATQSNPFLGDWVGLTGEQTDNGYITTVGDGVAPHSLETFPDGQFWIGVQFAFPDPEVGNDLPLAGTPMALRFFDGATLADSSRYNTVTSTEPWWIWETEPTANIVILDLRETDTIALHWEGGPGSHFRTRLPCRNPRRLRTLRLEAHSQCGDRYANRPISESNSPRAALLIIARPSFAQIVYDTKVEFRNDEGHGEVFTNLTDTPLSAGVPGAFD